MDIAVGRRRLVVSFIVEQKDLVSSRFPSAMEATDRELASIEARRAAKFERARWESSAALYGVGQPR